MADDCRYMDQLSSERKVMTVEAWDSDHEGHGEKKWKPLEHAPEGYSYAWLCCPCGAQHLRCKNGEK